MKVDTSRQDAAAHKWKPNHGSGKTHFNSIKSVGQSWTELRAEAKKKGKTYASK